MNKIQIVAASLGLTSILACWPFVVGKIPQNTITDQVAQFQHDNPEAQAEILSYQRGYLSSESVIHVVFVDPDLQAQLREWQLPTEYTINQHIQHGAFKVDIDMDIENKPLPLEVDVVAKPW